ncbi:MAG TPA: hypothetical protein DCM87_04440 [Planctomycetes bacterium]|nr:hypothetical protein [Planctomycetota bacterium]
MCGACAWAGDAAEKPAPQNVLSSIQIELGGRLKADMSWDDSRTNPGNYVLWVNREVSGPNAVSASGAVSRNDDEFNMTANETRLWLSLKGPVMHGVSTGGRLEVDFFGAGATENKSHLMLRRAYIDFGWDEYDLRVLAGQHSDVISPLVPTTINYSVGWDLGNIGYRRPQLRVTKKLGLGEAFGGPCSLELAGALTRTIGDSYTLLSKSDPPNNTESGEDSGFPTSQARVGLTIPGINHKPVTAGVSAHYGKEEYDGSTIDANTFSHRRTFESYSFNADIKVPLFFSPRLDFAASAEYFYGRNLDAYLGGISQGVNLTRGVGITSEGGWGQLTYQGLLSDTGLAFNAGAGVDNPHDGDLNGGAADRARNMFVFANVFYNLTAQLQLGAEYGWYRTEYGNDGEGKANRVQCAAIWNF